MVLRNIRFTEEQNSGLIKLWEDSGVRVSEIVRRAVVEYLEKRKPGRVASGASDPGRAKRR